MLGDGDHRKSISPFAGRGVWFAALCDPDIEAASAYLAVLLAAQAIGFPAGRSWAGCFPIICDPPRAVLPAAARKYVIELAVVPLPKGFDPC